MSFFFFFVYFRWR